MSEILLTRDGYEKLKEELEHLVTEVKPQNLKEIQHTRSYGDLRENAEYDAARQAQSMIEMRIRMLESKLSAATIVDQVDTSAVTVGARVKVRFIDLDEVMEFALLNVDEPDPGLEKITAESPVGKALMGRHVGEVADVETPNGTMRIEVVEIQPL